MTDTSIGRFFKAYRGAIIFWTGAAAILSLPATWLTEKGLAPERVGAIGLVLGIWGVALAVLGFGFTLWQLSRTQRSAEAVQDALGAIRRDYSSFDLVTEVRSAMHLAEEAIRHLGAGQWGACSMACHSLGVSLFRISSSEQIKDADEDDAKRHNEQALGASLELGYLAPDAPVERVRIAAFLQLVLGYLIRIEAAQRSSIGGN